MPENSRDDVRTVGAYVLARMADVATPDSLTSPGADFLDTVRCAAIQTWDDMADRNGTVDVEELIDNGQDHETANGCVPIYTHDKWRVFVDLAAYNEDLDDCGAESLADMDDTSNLALFIIARRLVVAVWEELAAADDVADDAAEGDDA